MKFLFRILAAFAGFLVVVSVFMLVQAASLTITHWHVRDCVASLVFLVFSFLAGRSTVWLWAESPFWLTKQKKAEVFALGTFLLTCPLVALVEHHHGDPFRAIAQISAIVASILVYLATRYSFAGRAARVKS